MTLIHTQIEVRLLTIISRGSEEEYFEEYKNREWWECPRGRKVLMLCFVVFPLGHLSYKAYHCSRMAREMFTESVPAYKVGQNKCIWRIVMITNSLVWERTKPLKRYKDWEDAWQDLKYLWGRNGRKRYLKHIGIMWLAGRVAKKCLNKFTTLILLGEFGVLSSVFIYKWNLWEW